MKTNCFRKKLDYLFQKVKEKYEIEKQSNKLKEELQKQKKEEREKELEIIKLRANHLEFHPEKEPKGEAFYGRWKDIHPISQLKKFSPTSSNLNYSMC